jgi:hypothetical protein
MALSIYARPRQPAVYGNPRGMADQNALYRTLMMNAPGADQTTPNPPPANVSTTPARPPTGVPGVGDTYDPNLEFFPVRPGQSTTPYAPSPAQEAQAFPASSGSSDSSSSNSPYNIDFSGDPILAKIRAMNAQNIANAENAALAGRKQQLIGYGFDPALQGLYPDEATAEAARQNPFSTLAQLLFNHQQQGQQLTEALNKANLFYSGERIKQTGLEGRNYTLQQSQAGNALQNALNTIANSVLAAKMQAQQAELQGESDAYTRALNFALQNNTGGGGSDTGGGGSGGYDKNDFLYGATLPPGYSVDDLHAAAIASAPPGATPMHVMNQGMVQDGKISVKYKMPDGTTNTIWIPLPGKQQNNQTTQSTSSNTSTNTSSSSSSPTTTSTSAAASSRRGPPRE